MKNALNRTVVDLPAEKARSLTWVPGKQMSAHPEINVDFGLPVFFADPQSPWQRTTNENSKGLLRWKSPNGTGLSRWSADEIEAVAHAINTRSRMFLGWKTPAPAFDQQLR